ncbi:hypothetical protein VNO77_22029 [Canavalia gladiata]|uniref:Uncharacterized protein n=1 Tax=Canavalia gladiata TaxID=3824 RepID=A0AAN9QA50_CANGL
MGGGVGVEMLEKVEAFGAEVREEERLKWKADDRRNRNRNRKSPWDAKIPSSIEYRLHYSGRVSLGREPQMNSLTLRITFSSFPCYCKRQQMQKEKDIYAFLKRTPIRL